jgi:hypothetical protein
MNVSVFGGSQPQPGDPAYAEAVELGRLIALAGHTVLTGGYIGTMEAVSRGASEAGGHVIGVTCKAIESWRSQAANSWVAEEWRTQSLLERLEVLIGRAEACLALSGGPGTLTEVALCWNLMIIGSLPRRPLILIGDAWQTVFDQFLTTLGSYIPGSQRDLLRFSPSIASAVNLLKEEIIKSGAQDD